MSLDTLMSDAGPDIYYDPAFREVLESHMSWLRNHPTTLVRGVDPSTADQYNHDLPGLLRHYSAPDHLHWVIRRLNDIPSPYADLRDLTSLLWPNQTTVSHIQQSHSGSNRI